MVGQEGPLCIGLDASDLSTASSKARSPPLSLAGQLVRWRSFRPSSGKECPWIHQLDRVVSITPWPRRLPASPSFLLPGARGVHARPGRSSQPFLCLWRVAIKAVLGLEEFRRLRRCCSFMGRVRALSRSPSVSRLIR